MKKGTLVQLKRCEDNSPYTGSFFTDTYKVTSIMDRLVNIKSLNDGTIITKIPITSLIEAQPT